MNVSRGTTRLSPDVRPGVRDGPAMPGDAGCADGARGRQSVAGARGGRRSEAIKEQPLEPADNHIVMPSPFPAIKRDLGWNI